MILNYWTLQRKLHFKYDEIKKASQGDVTIDYGIIPGSSTIIFIKVGYEEPIHGYENKYLKMAKELHNIYGCTVIVSSNPNGYDDDFDAELKFIQTYSINQNLGNIQIFYMGISDGASLGMMNGYKYPVIKRMLFVNGPLFRDPDKIIKGIESFSGERITFVYGKEAPSFSKSKIFKDLERENVSLVFYEENEQYFSKHFSDFKDLPKKFLF